MGGLKNHQHDLSLRPGFEKSLWNSHNKGLIFQDLFFRRRIPRQDFWVLWYNKHHERVFFDVTFFCRGHIPKLKSSKNAFNGR